MKKVTYYSKFLILFIRFYDLISSKSFIFFKFLFYIFIFYVWEFCLHHVCIWCLWRQEVGVASPVTWIIVVSHCVGAGNWTWVPCKSSWCSWPLAISPAPSYSFLHIFPTTPPIHCWLVKVLYNQMFVLLVIFSSCCFFYSLLKILYKFYTFVLGDLI